MSRLFKYGPVVLTAAAALVLTACTTSSNANSPGGGTAAGVGASTSTPQTAAEQEYAKYASMTPAERDPKLLADAKAQGGTLIIYGQSTEGKLATAFTKEFGIKATEYDLDPNEELTRLTQEASANKYIADVIGGPGNNLTQLDESSSLLATYQNPIRDTMNDQAKGKNWTGFVQVPYVVGINTKDFKLSDLPSDYLGFADPKWKGKITLEQDSYDWLAALHQYYVTQQGMSESDFTAKMKALASNATVVEGNSQEATYLGTGKVQVCLQCLVHSVLGGKADGSPIAWMSVPPYFLRYDGMALLAHAPQAAAAMLFEDWTLSDDGGVKVITGDQRVPANAKSDVPTTGNQVVDFDNDEFNKDAKMWQTQYDQLLRGTLK